MQPQLQILLLSSGFEYSNDSDHNWFLWGRDVVPTLLIVYCEITHRSLANFPTTQSHVIVLLDNMALAVLCIKIVTPAKETKILNNYK